MRVRLSFKSEPAEGKKHSAVLVELFVQQYSAVLLAVPFGVHDGMQEPRNCIELDHCCTEATAVRRPHQCYTTRRTLLVIVTAVRAHDVFYNGRVAKLRL